MFKIALQLYGVQDVCCRDFPGALKTLAGFGYQGIEFLPIKSLDARSVANDLLQAGLQAVGYYVFDPRKLLAPDNELYGDLKALGIHDVTIGYQDRVPNDWAAAIEDVRRIADVVHRQGLNLHYHNHEQELQCVQGHPALELLAQQTDKKLVQFELDTYMAAKAGEDPVKWIERLAGRMSRLHIKDIHRRDDSVAVFGKGALDSRAILNAARHSGVKWLVVEFHPGLANPLEMARLCLEGVRQILAEMNVHKKEQYHEKN